MSPPIVCAAENGSATIYVAVDGDDSRAGDAPDKAFASPARAAQSVRERRDANGGKLPGPVTVELGGGTYYLPAPLVLTPEHSGTADAPVVWAARDGEQVVLSGGTPVTGWHEAELNGKPVWAAKLPDGAFVRELWVGGERRTRARQPNAGAYLSVPETAAPAAEWSQGQDFFRYVEGDVPAFTVEDAEVVAFTRWVESRLPVVGVNREERRFRFARRSVFQTQAGDLYHIENAPEFLDQPGEWFLRRATGELFYLPKPGETREGFVAIVPRLPQLLRLEGRPDAQESIEHVTFKGITFAHAEWSLPDAPPEERGQPPRGGFSQAAQGLPAAVHAEWARHCAFEGCAVRHAGTYGIELGRGCQDNRVASCTLTDLGGGGIKLGETRVRPDKADHAFGNGVTDCTIAHLGRLFPSAVGVWVGQSYDNVIAHNDIHDLYYTGISVGWTWGYDATALASGNVVEHNHVHHIGKLSDGDGPMLSDMAGIYTLGPQPGTVIRNNRFHDVHGRVYGGWGIYFDEGTSQVVAERNLVYNTTHGGFHQHYGRDNTVRNNIFAFGQSGQVVRSRSEAHTSFTFSGNLVIWKEGEGVVGSWDNLNATFGRNLYWPFAEAQPRFGNGAFDEWRAKGMDEGSAIADPGFADAERLDFTLKDAAGGPASKVGFKPWDLADVGRRGQASAN